MVRKGYTPEQIINKLIKSMYQAPTEAKNRLTDKQRENSEGMEVGWRRRLGWVYWSTTIENLSNFKFLPRFSFNWL